MINLVGRAQWRARTSKGTTRLTAAPRGVKVHYVGARVAPAIVADHGRCVDLVKGIQRTHMDENLWADIGYTAAACPHRDVFEGRGPWALPAANGPGLNAQHYAVLALVGDEGLIVPPDGMLHAICDAIEWLRREGGAGAEVLGHRDGYETDCPGDWLYDWIRRGHPRPGEDGPRPTPPAWPGRVLAYPPLMQGEDVRTWQRRMKRRGWALDVDGLYGPRSTEVARAFQREKGLKATGKVNRATWEAAWTAPIT